MHPKLDHFFGILELNKTVNNGLAKCECNSDVLRGGGQRADFHARLIRFPTILGRVSLT